MALAKTSSRLARRAPKHRRGGAGARRPASRAGGRRAVWVHAPEVQLSKPGQPREPRRHGHHTVPSQVAPAAEDACEISRRASAERSGDSDRFAMQCEYSPGTKKTPLSTPSFSFSLSLSFNPTAAAATAAATTTSHRPIQCQCMLHFCPFIPASPAPRQPSPMHSYATDHPSQAIMPDPAVEGTLRNPNRKSLKGIIGVRGRSL